MKNVVLLFVFVLFGSVQIVGAKEKQNEFFLGAGIASERDLATAGIWKLRREGAGSTTVRSSGVYHFGYRFLNKEKVSLGLFATTELMKVTRTGAAMPEMEGKYSESKDTYLALLLDIRYNWGGRSGARWYSGLAPGIGWYKRKEIHNDFSLIRNEFSRARFSYHATALGFGFGKKVGGYIELGYGAKGLLAVGVCLKP